MNKLKKLKGKTIRRRMAKIELDIQKIIEKTKKETDKLDKQVIELQNRCNHNDVILAGPDFPPTFKECMFPVKIGDYYCKDCGLSSIEKFGINN